MMTELRKNSTKSCGRDLKGQQNRKSNREEEKRCWRIYRTKLKR